MTRLADAWAASTARSYIAMFRLFMAFLIFTDTSIHQVKIHNFLAFLEFLTVNGTKASQLMNYISAIKACYVRFSLPVDIFENQQIAMFTKSVQKTASFQVHIPKLVDVDLLKLIIQNCKYTFLGPIFKCTYLLGFFGFLRLSNLVPHSMSTFSVMKHMCKGDFFFSDSEMIILLKWTKTLQNNNQARLLKLPYLKNCLCPAKAVKECLKLVPGDNNAPIFQYKIRNSWIPLTDSKVRQHLKNVLQMAGKPMDYVTFHSFRRSGASLAFNHNVPLQEIQRHGT